MTARRSKDNSGQPPSKPGPSEKLLTSQDIFGDMIDAPIETGDTPTPAPRASPIRAQISEPVAGQPARVARVDTPNEMREVAPEEMAALLEMFDGPSAKGAD